MRTLLSDLQRELVSECMLVSTCNRTELYYVPHESTANGTPIWRFLAARKHAETIVTEKNFYFLSSVGSAKHLFTVASGIDSMVLGDFQILNKIKEAYTIARELNTTGIVLNRLIDSALHVGKRTHAETEISEGAVSVSYAAAELASKIFSDLSEHSALLIGAGETGKLTAKHLCGRNLGTLFLANRTRKH